MLKALARSSGPLVSNIRLIQSAKGEPLVSNIRLVQSAKGEPLVSNLGLIPSPKGEPLISNNYYYKYKKTFKNEQRNRDDLPKKELIQVE